MDMAKELKGKKMAEKQMEGYKATFLSAGVDVR
jgi:hypothetical protein